MAAVSLFRDTNMAAVTSRENTLYFFRLVPLIRQVLDTWFGSIIIQYFSFLVRVWGKS